MNSIRQAAAMILDRSPDPALSLEELGEALKGELQPLPPSSEQLLEVLKADPDLRILRRPPSEGELPLGPSAWILSRRPCDREERHGHPLEEQLRDSLFALSELVEPESLVAWARWNRILNQERRVRDALRRRRSRRTKGQTPH